LFLRLQEEIQEVLFGKGRPTNSKDGEETVGGEIGEG